MSATRFHTHTKLRAHIVPLRSKYSPQHPILKHPQPAFLPQCQRPGFTPVQNYGHTSSLWGPNTLLNTLFSNTLSLRSSFALNKIKFVTIISIIYLSVDISIAKFKRYEYHKQNFHYHFHNTLPLMPILSQMNPVHTLPLTFRSQLITTWKQSPECIIFFSEVCTMSPSVSSTKNENCQAYFESYF